MIKAELALSLLTEGETSHSGTLESGRARKGSLDSKQLSKSLESGLHIFAFLSELAVGKHTTGCSCFPK